ncbi:hypothetical protein [Dyadobacter fermentans]|uniref:hypothetical protein n=1 Tax=Dyadobacter fermentans TaxID=94254 RepID=UPI001CBBA609|nr:hypothetical protein [Dyadobacter fermentans]MBZ1361988.1 hypothetical protein [Dyadobacter fermentans]
MSRKTIWIIAICLTIVLAIEPLGLLFHFYQNPSREAIFSKAMEIPMTPITIGIMALVLTLLVALVPFKGTTYAHRFKRIYPFVLSVLAVIVIFSLYHVTWLEAASDEPVSPVHLF